MSNGKDQDSEGRTRVAAELIAALESLSSDLLDASVPIYQLGGQTYPEVVGSAVLVALGEIRFLVTAGHVFDLISEGQLLAGVSPEFLTVAGLPTRLRSPGSRTTKDDKIDLCALRLIDRPWLDLALSSFVPASRIDLVPPLATNQTYGLVGFPNSVNRRGPVGDRLAAAALRIAGLESAAEAYVDTGTNPQTNVMVGFSKTRMLDAAGHTNLPDLYGASGGGLWRYGRRVREAVAPPLLSAIAIEWHKRGRVKHVLGTRMTLLLDALSEKYDDVRSFLRDYGRTTLYSRA